MRYRLYNEARGLKAVPATIWTRDCKVRDATPAFAWAIGKHVFDVIWWAYERGFRVRCDSACTHRKRMED